jgi:hypothetical protein
MCAAENLFIEDGDVTLDELPSAEKCAELSARFEREGFWPNVFRINERGNVDVLVIDGDTYAIVGGWV